MTEKKKRSYAADTEALQVQLSARLNPQQHQQFVKMMERSGWDEDQRKDLLNRLIEHLKRI